MKKVKVKLKIRDHYYSIQTRGVFAGRPAYFIVVDKTTKNKSIKLTKLLKQIVSNNASHLCVIHGMDQDITPLVEGIIRKGMYVQIETDGQTNYQKLPWLPNSVFAVVTPTTKVIDKTIAEKALAFKYIVNDNTVLGKDGLPKKLYKPKDPRRIMVEPEWSDDKKQFRLNMKVAANISMFFGFYLSFPVNKILGVK